MISTATQSVLIIEDDYDTLLTLKELIGCSGYEVITATDRDEAISILRSVPIDIIVLDYMMPGQSAIKFVDRVRSCYPHTRIILATAGMRVDAVARMLGIQEFIAKPIDPEQLLNVLGSPPIGQLDGT